VEDDAESSEVAARLQEAIMPPDGPILRRKLSRMVIVRPSSSLIADSPGSHTASRSVRTSLVPSSGRFKQLGRA
jgi:hypothetical protein